LAQRRVTVGFVDALVLVDEDEDELDVEPLEVVELELPDDVPFDVVLLLVVELDAERSSRSTSWRSKYSCWRASCSWWSSRSQTRARSGCSHSPAAPAAAPAGRRPA